MKKVAEQIKFRCSGEGSQKKFKTDTTSEKKQRKRSMLAGLKWKNCKIDTIHEKGSGID